MLKYNLYNKILHLDNNVLNINVCEKISFLDIFEILELMSFIINKYQTTENIYD